MNHQDNENPLRFNEL